MLSKKELDLIRIYPGTEWRKKLKRVKDVEKLSFDSFYKKQIKKTRQVVAELFKRENK